MRQTCTLTSAKRLRWRTSATTPTATTQAPAPSGTVAPLVVTAAADDAVRLSFVGMRPDTGVYAVQWVRADNTFNSYDVVKSTSSRVALPLDWFACATRYTFRVFVMQRDWQPEYGHGSENVTSHSEPVTIGIPPCRAPAPLAWLQRGATLYGDAADNAFGQSIAMSDDGSVVAVGSQAGDLNYRGRIRVFAWSGTAWTRRGSDILGTADGDYSGTSIDMSADGTTIVTGAWGKEVSGNANTGAARIYVWNGSAWMQRGSDIDGSDAGDEFGTSVAVSDDGTVVAVGADRSDSVTDGSNVGSVAVYSWNGSSWVQRGGTIRGTAMMDLLGQSVALSGDGSVVAGGAWYADAGGSYRGYVGVYSWSGSAWVRRGTNINGRTNGDLSGFSVALSQDATIIGIGARGRDFDGLTDRGSVAFYEWNGTSYVFHSEIFGRGAGDEAGWSIALSADGMIAAIGAKGDDNNGADSGSVIVYGWNGAAWVQRGGDLDGSGASAAAGSGVGLSADGLTVAVGADGDDGVGSYVGAARVFRHG